MLKQAVGGGSAVWIYGVNNNLQKSVCNVISENGEKNKR